MGEMRVHRPSHLNTRAYAEIPSNRCVPNTAKFLEITTLSIVVAPPLVNFLIRTNKTTFRPVRQSHMKNHARNFPHKLSKSDIDSLSITPSSRMMSASVLNFCSRLTRHDPAADSATPPSHGNDMPTSMPNLAATPGSFNGITPKMTVLPPTFTRLLCWHKALCAHNALS